jgi:hypothetical protein
MSPKPSYEEKLNQLLDACFEELQAMPDKEVMQGERVEDVRSRAASRIERARLEAGRRRMAAARTKAASTHRGELESLREGVSPAEARAYIRRAANDARYTLAARKLEEMSDEEMLQLYEQIRELDAGESSDHS